MEFRPAHTIQDEILNFQKRLTGIFKICDVEELDIIYHPNLNKWVIR
jgi:hypothetical protein